MTLLTLPEVAAYLAVELRTVQRWAKNGTMPAIKAVGQWRVDRGKFEIYLDFLSPEEQVRAQRIGA